MRRLASAATFSFPPGSCRRPGCRPPGPRSHVSRSRW
jgi:hypothetical protein